MRIAKSAVPVHPRQFRIASNYRSSDTLRSEVSRSTNKSPMQSRRSAILKKGETQEHGIERSRDCENRQVGWQRFDSSDQVSSASRTRDHPDRRALGLLGEGGHAVTNFHRTPSTHEKAQRYREGERAETKMPRATVDAGGRERSETDWDDDTSCQFSAAPNSEGDGP